MTAQIRFDLGSRGYAESYERQVAAVGTWVSSCLKQGGRPEPHWNDALHRRSEKRAAHLSLDAHGLDDDAHRIGIRTDGRWRLAGGSWHDRLLALLAVPADAREQGAAARRALRRVTTPATRVRIVTYHGESVDGDTRQRVRRVLGAVVENDALHLFDPLFGLWSYRVGGSFDEAVRWFRRAIERTHADELEIHGMTVHVVDVIDVFCTWFGPPAAPVKGVRADLAGPLALADARFSSPQKPRIRFCCLSRNRDDYAALDGIDLVHPDEVLPAARPMRVPDFGDLDACVATIVAAAIERPEDRRARLDAKNAWALHCLHRYGGYHFDADIAPLADASSKVRLHVPRGFGAMTPVGGEVLGDGDGRFAAGPDGMGRYEHLRGAFGRSGLDCMALSGETRPVLRPLLERVAGVEPREPAFDPQLPRIGVGVLRAPRGDAGAERALRLYVWLWFALRDARESMASREDLDSAHRHAVVSAVATGLTHGGRDADDHLQPDPIRNDGVFSLQSLGLRSLAGRVTLVEEDVVPS